MAVPHALVAVRAFLRATAAVTALVPADRIWGGEMPSSEVSAQARGSIVVQLAGGPASRDYVEVGRTRVDVRSYGASQIEAMNIDAAVYEALKHMNRDRITGITTPTLLHDVSPEGGPTALRDPDGDWHFVLRSYIVLAAEVAA